MRLLIIIILLLTIPTFAQTIRARPDCTEPPTATPCLNSDGTERRHTVPEWQEVERKRNEAAFFVHFIAAAKQMASEPVLWVVLVVTAVILMILQRAKRGVERVEANFNEQRNIAIEAIELAERYERELKRRKAA